MHRTGTLLEYNIQFNYDLDKKSTPLNLVNKVSYECQPS